MSTCYALYLVPVFYSWIYTDRHGRSLPGISGAISPSVSEITVLRRKATCKPVSTIMSRLVETIQNLNLQLQELLIVHKRRQLQGNSLF